MFRFIFYFIAALVLAAIVLFFTVFYLPSWYDKDSSTSNSNALQKLSQKYSGSSGSRLLASKLQEVLSGRLSLDEKELTALVYTALESSTDGRRLLQVSDKFKVQIHSNTIEVGTIVNLKKLAAVDAKARKKINKFKDKVPFLYKERFHVAIESEPVVKGGQLVFDENISAKIGGISLPASVLKNLGISKADLRKLRISVPNVRFNSVNVEKNNLSLGLKF